MGTGAVGLAGLQLLEDNGQEGGNVTTQQCKMVASHAWGQALKLLSEIFEKLLGRAIEGP